MVSQYKLMSARGLQKWRSVPPYGPMWLREGLYTFFTYVQYFGSVGWTSGKASSCKKLSSELLAWLSVWMEVQMVCMWSSWCHCHPVISCFIKIQIGLTFLVPAYPGCPETEAVKRVSVCLSYVLKLCPLKEWQQVLQAEHPRSAAVM